jgi:hypothetical protein
MTSTIQIQHYYFYSSHYEQHLLLRLRYILSHCAANTGGKAEEKHKQRHGLEYEWRNDDESDNRVLSKPAHLTPNAAINSPALSPTRKVLSQLKLATPSLRVCQPDVRLEQLPAVRRLRSMLIMKLSGELIPHSLEVAMYSFNSPVHG